MAGGSHTTSITSHGELDSGKAELHAHDLTETEHQILDSQLNIPPVKASYFMLFRYATNVDKLIIFISAISAIAAGVIFPLMTVRIQQSNS
jgi:ATP-binding cassette subfamily B (MDR/TAP) protein 1